MESALPSVFGVLSEMVNGTFTGAPEVGPNPLVSGDEFRDVLFRGICVEVISGTPIVDAVDKIAGYVGWQSHAEEIRSLFEAIVWTPVIRMVQARQAAEALDSASS